MSITGSISSLKRMFNELEFVRRRRIPAVVIVGDMTYTTHLEASPQVGDALDVGIPVVVTEVTPAPGGGLIVEAQNVPASDR
jgi:hypothetical protein